MIAHEHRLRVYYADTDAGGVMYHAAYLNFAERARTEALRAAGLPHAQMQAEHGVIFMVRRAEIEYFRPARLDDVVVVRTVSAGCTAATVSLRQDFSADGVALAVASFVLVCVRPTLCVRPTPGGAEASARAARIPARWRSALG